MVSNIEIKKKCFCVDIGPSRLVGMSPTTRRVGTRDMMVYCSEAEEELGDVEENLQHLTVGIPNVATDKVPRHYQHHTVGVSEQFSRLLHRVAQAITCYDA